MEMEGGSHHDAAAAGGGGGSVAQDSASGLPSAGAGAAASSTAEGLSDPPGGSLGGAGGQRPKLATNRLSRQEAKRIRIARKMIAGVDVDGSKSLDEVGDLGSDCVVVVK